MLSKGDASLSTAGFARDFLLLAILLNVSPLSG